MLFLIRHLASAVNWLSPRSDYLFRGKLVKLLLKQSISGVKVLLYLVFSADDTHISIGRMLESSGRLTQSAPPFLHIEQLAFDEAVRWTCSDKSAESPCSYDDIDLVCYEEYLRDDISYSDTDTNNWYFIDIGNTPDRFTQLVANALRVQNRRGLLVQNANTLVLD
jgi:hypothetical protein